MNQTIKATITTTTWSAGIISSIVITIIAHVSVKVLCPLFFLFAADSAACCCCCAMCHLKQQQHPQAEYKGILYIVHIVFLWGAGEDSCLPFFTMTLPTRKTTGTLLLFYRVYIAYTYSNKRGSVWGQHTCCQSLMPAQCDDDTSWEWHFIYSELEVCWAFFLCFWFQFQIEY